MCLYAERNKQIGFPLQKHQNSIWWPTGITWFTFPLLHRLEKKYQCSHWSEPCFFPNPKPKNVCFFFSSVHRAMMRGWGFVNAPWPFEEERGVHGGTLKWAGVGGRGWGGELIVGLWAGAAKGVSLWRFSVHALRLDTGRPQQVRLLGVRISGCTRRKDFSFSNCQGLYLLKWLLAGQGSDCL